MEYQYVVFLVINSVLSLVTYWLTVAWIPSLPETFIRRKLFGIDCHKRSKPVIPEAFGIVIGLIFLIVSCLFLFLRFGFYDFSRNELDEVLASLLSVSFMLLLGFVDDIFDLRWRHKLFIPTVASLPLLIVYRINFNSTTILMPKPLRHMFGNSIDLGFFYYVYMGMLAVFCTNAINIYAGINGLECGQSVVIAVSVLTFNIVELFGSAWKSHVLSMCFILPFLAVSLALLKYNWYPSRVFVGDTYCYFAGVLFAVVGILGHFSKTLLLFFIPQIFNFLYSVPQLFHFIPCPRHRFPLLSEESDVLVPSFVEFSLNEISFLGKIFYRLFLKIGLIRVERKGNTVRCNNFTLLNLMLILFGSCSERSLTVRLLILQVLCTCIAFTLRYPLASYFYDVQK